MWNIISKKREGLSSQEAYNLWDMLQSRYLNVEQIQIFQNFIHDKDFKKLSKLILDSNLEPQINELEKTLNDYNIGLPRRPAKSVRTPANTEAIEDRFVAALFTTLLQENLSFHLRAIRTSLTNDSIRKLFIKFLRDEIQIYDKSNKYFKLKGWTGTPPHVSPNTFRNPGKVGFGRGLSSMGSFKFQV